MKRKFRVALMAAVWLQTLGFATEMWAGEGPSLYHTLQEKKNPDGGIELAEGVSLGALIEAEAFVSSRDDEDESDFVLATFQLDGSVDVTENIGGRVVLLWEEDDTEPIDLDEAVLSLGGTDKIPVTLEAGKMYLPFGRFRSHFVSDPLVLELGETRETAVQLITSVGPLDLAAGAFNGDVDEDGDNQIDGFFASVGLVLADHLDAGVYWLSDLGDSDGLEETLLDALSAETEDQEAEVTSYSDVGAVGGYLTLHAFDHLLHVDAEVIGAVDDFDAGLLADVDQAPFVWNLECAIHLHEAAVECAAKVEGSDEVPEFPETQWGLAVVYGFHDWTTISAEYLRGEFEDGGDRDLVTVQLALEL